MNLAENSLCADCEAPDPLWFDYCFSVFVCSQCAQAHQAFGILVSAEGFWQERYVAALRLGGNQQFAAFLRNYGLDRAEPAQKYTSCAAQYYKSQLASLMNGLQFDLPPPSCRRGAEPSQKPVNSFGPSTEVLQRTRFVTYRNPCRYCRASFR